MNDWNPSNPSIQEAEDFGNVPPSEAYKKSKPYFWCEFCNRRIGKPERTIHEMQGHKVVRKIVGV